jgi:hypothetical protein
MPRALLPQSRPLPAAALATLLIATLAAPPAFAQSAEERIERSRALVMPARCREKADPDEIVVCGARRDPDRYRLPIRNERTLESRYERVRGDIGRASLDAAPAPCGIFQGQRRCGKAEMADYGYGQGRDPLTVGAKIVEQLADPD